MSCPFVERQFFFSLSHRLDMYLQALGVAPENAVVIEDSVVGLQVP